MWAYNRVQLLLPIIIFGLRLKIIGGGGGPYLWYFVILNDFTDIRTGIFRIVVVVSWVLESSFI